MASKYVRIILLALVIQAMAVSAAAPCEIPCDIYDDPLRAKLIANQAETIEKSMRQIIELRRKTPVDGNQLVRRVNNKAAHASEVQHIVWRYVMTQRIRPEVEKKDGKLAVLYQMRQAATKCKQSTDLGQGERLRSLLK